MPKCFKCKHGKQIILGEFPVTYCEVKGKAICYEKWIRGEWKYRETCQKCECNSCPHFEGG